MDYVSAQGKSCHMSRGRESLVSDSSSNSRLAFFQVQVQVQDQDLQHGRYSVFCFSYPLSIVVLFLERSADECSGTEPASRYVPFCDREGADADRGEESMGGGRRR